MDTLHEVMNFCGRQQTILGCSIVSLLTAGIEQIFSYVAFECPCNSRNMLYGCSFLLTPAFVLFLLGFMVNPRTWHLLTGKCSPEKHLNCSPWGTSAVPCADFWLVLVPMTAKALVAPLTWIAVALLGAKFYECAASGNSLVASYFCKDNGTDCRDLLLKMPCNENLAAVFPSEQLSLRAQSQVIGWFLIASIMTAALISACVRHFFSPISYRQLMFRKIYTKEEHELFEKKAKEHATKLAERNINCFFEATDPAPFHIPSNEDWQAISVGTASNSQEQYFSMLHKYVNNKIKNGSPHCTDSGNWNKAQACVSRF